MDVANLEEMIKTAKRKIDLFGADNFRSWMLYFVPGDGTDMHYHTNPETFLVLAGSGVVKGLKGEERPIQKNEVLFLNLRTIIRSPIRARSRWFFSATARKPLAVRTSRRTARIETPGVVDEAYWLGTVD